MLELRCAVITAIDNFVLMQTPNVNGMTTTVAQDEQCGRHILNFIAHNPAVLQNFMTALKLHQLKGSNQLPSAIDALRYEKEWGTFSLMHQVCYEAVITLKMQNNLPCFGNVDVMTMLNEEAGQKFKSSRSQYEDDEVPF